MKSFKSLARWYFSRDALPYWTVLVVDSFIVVLSGLLAFALLHGAMSVIDNFCSLLATMGIFLVCFMVGFRAFHTYSGVIRYSSFSDLLRVIMANMLGILLSVIVQWAIGPASWLVWFGAVDFILFGLFSMSFMWIIRIWVKTVYESIIHTKKRTPVYIFGVKAGGVAIAKNLNGMANARYCVAGFVTEDEAMANRVLMGKHVYRFNDALLGRMRRDGVSTIIVSPLMMNSLRERSGFVDQLIDAGIKILVFSGTREWDGHSDLNVSTLKPIDLEDLLPRQKIEVDMDAAEKLLAGKVVMITGAAGSIGSEMVRQIATYGPSRMVLVDQAETPMHDIRLEMKNHWPSIEADTIVCDITDRNYMERIFAETCPDYVFHAAAYKHVPMMETNPYESVINNIYGTKVIADLSVKYGTKKFVMVSTDKAVNPTNVMGCSKRICEIYVQSLDKAVKDGLVEGQTQFVTTRFGNVLGSNGSVIPLFQEQIRKGGPVTVTHPEIIRFFMLIPEACRLVIEAGTMGHGGEIFVFDMGEPVKRADLARRMILLSGAKDVEIVYTGLREGEKLYEEVLNDEEIALPTFHPKIKIAKVREYTYAEVNQEIGEMIGKSREEDKMQIVRRMKALVPEFKSKNSPYEALDNH